MKTTLLSTLLLCGGMAFAQSIGITEFATGLSQPTDVITDGSNRLFVTEQGGTIKIVQADGTVAETPFLDISSLVSTGGEQGLLGLAFHPDYATNGLFYINYTDTDGDTVIARYTVSTTDANVANAGSAITLLTVEQPFDNHNGGSLHFGPDGYLYVALGDGGNGNDPNGNAQNKETLLGKLLRLDVSGSTGYTIPEGNPFAGTDGMDEIWAYGLRNPWKFSFDSETGALWIADVGQGAIEEINMEASTEGGLNYGWRCFEGTQATSNQTGCSDTETFTPPVAQYTHDDGCSITGGYVYRGATYTALQGKYIFADYCSNSIGYTDTDGEITWTTPFSGSNFSTFGQDADGELYVAARTTGTLYRITDTTAGITQFNNATVKLYPNPTNGILNISAATAEPFTLKLYDLQGKVLLQQEVTTAETTINISALGSGVYMAELSGTNGSARQKLVVN